MNKPIILIVEIHLLNIISIMIFIVKKKIFLIRFFISIIVFFSSSCLLLRINPNSFIINFFRFVILVHQDSLQILQRCLSWEHIHGWHLRYLLCHAHRKPLECFLNKKIEILLSLSLSLFPFFPNWRSFKVIQCQKRVTLFLMLW